MFSDLANYIALVMSQSSLHNLYNTAHKRLRLSDYQDDDQQDDDGMVNFEIEAHKLKGRMK